MKEKIDISHIADLAQLSFTSEELDTFENDMAELLGLADKLRELDLTDTYYNTDNRESVFREDEPKDSLPAGEMIGAAKTSRDGYITVPRVVEE